MAEIKHNDIQEVKNPSVENYNKIVPENGTNMQKAEGILKDIIGKSREEDFIDLAKSETNNDVEKTRYEHQENPRYIITKNESLENGVHPITGVPFFRKIVDLPSGERIEGVFPEFESSFDAKLPEDMYLQTDKIQFKECNKQLAEAIEKDPELKSKFSPEQIEQIRDGIVDGTAPDGYVWHHDAEAGKMQLVDFETHSKTGHTGGRAVWGGGSDFR